MNEKHILELGSRKGLENVAMGLGWSASASGPKGKGYYSCWASAAGELVGKEQGAVILKIWTLLPTPSQGCVCV